MSKTYTEAEIKEAVVNFAIFHEVETDAVSVLRTYREGQVIGFLLSLDVNGRSAGVDETHGEME